MRKFAFLAAVAVLACAAPATAADTALADRLFKEGQELLRTGRVVEACVKFEKSFAEDSQLGTLLNLAFCHEKAARPGKAWLEYRDAEARAIAAGNRERARFAKERMTDLERDLMRCRVEGAPVKEVRIDGDKVTRAETGEPFFVETGLHHFGFVDKDGHVTVRDIHVVKAAFVQPIRAPAANETPTVDPKSTKSASVSPFSTPWPWVAAGVGLVGLGMGATFGLLAVDTAKESNGKPAKSTEQTDLASEAKTYALLSDIGWGLLVAGAAAGTVMILWPSVTTSGSGSQSAVRLQLLGTGAGLNATF